MENKRKVCLISGCSSGIGFCLAKTFARNGWTVYAGVRDIGAEGAEKLKSAAELDLLSLHPIQLDITNENSVQQAVENISNKEEKIDLLINNAGIMFLGPVESFSTAEIKQQFETNYFGTIRVTQKIIPIMRNQQSGKIITISSINGLLSAPLYGIYSSSKFALESTMEVLGFELSPFGIKCALVEPGIFNTNIWSSRYLAANQQLVLQNYSKLVTFFGRADKGQKILNRSIIADRLNPQRVADAVYKLSQQKNPRLRTLVGLDAKLLYVLRNLLPYSIWKWLLGRAFNWK